MSNTLGGTDIVGGMGYGGGFGGIAPIGLIGLNTFLGGRGGFGGDAALNGGGIVASTVADQNVSELRKDVQGVNTTVEALGNEIAGTFFNLTNNINTNFRGLDNQICGIDKTIMQGNFALSSQMSNFQHSVDNQFCAIKSAIHADGDATRALITSNLIDGLRADLAGERRSRDNREIEINVTQTNQQTQTQLQAQLQSQNQFLASMFNSLGDQVNRAANSVVNVGSGTVAAPQSNNQANTKVNS